MFLSSSFLVAHSPVSRFPSILLAAIFTLLAIASTGCSGSDEHIPLETPKGWAGNTTYWWQVAADTTGAFRDLESLESMDIAGSDLLSMRIDGASVQEMQFAQGKFNLYVKESLIELLRNEPEIVDSLFERYVVPRIQMDDLSGDVQPLIKEQQRRGYQILSRHFRYPRTLTRLGTDIPVPVPDSLRDNELSGAVFFTDRTQQGGRSHCADETAGRSSCARPDCHARHDRDALAARLRITRRDL